MSDTDSSDDIPPRNLSALALGTKLLSLDLSRTMRTRKTLILFLIQLLPALAAAVSLFWGDLDGLVVFEGAIERVYLVLLLPLAALFFGGPTIVDEVEGETITYLTLRPIPRTTLLLAKLGSSILSVLAVTVIPVVAFFVVCVIGSPATFGDGLGMLGQAVAATAVGAITYTAVFALLGVIFSSTLLPGIVYYVVFELVLANLPVLEFLSIKFHLFTLGGFDQLDPGEDAALGQMILDEPLVFDWWVGLLMCGIITATAVAIATVVFRDRQFNV